MASDGFARALFYVAWLSLWLLVATVFVRVPGPVEVIEQLYAEYLRGEIVTHFARTLSRFGGAVILAVLAGTAIGVMTGLSPLARVLISDAILVGLALPGLLWAFLTVMWFGMGWVAPVVAAILTATPFVALNVAKGVQGVSRPKMATGARPRPSRRRRLPRRRRAFRDYQRLELDAPGGVVRCRGRCRISRSVLV